MEKLIRLVRGYLNEEEWSDTHEAAISLITRIGKAYAEGELKIRGEVGRIEGVLAEEIIQHFFPGKEGDILIALSPTRRGEEEEKTGEFPHFEPDEPSFIAEIH